MRILIIEDNAYDAEMAQRQLKLDLPEYTIDIACSLNEAREFIKTRKDYQAALIDLNLPDGFGLEILSEIRNMDKKMTMIILSGSGDEDIVVSALKYGADDYLIKKRDYLSKLASVVKDNLNKSSERIERSSRFINVLYVEHHQPDIDLTIHHFQKYAPQIKIEVVNSGEQALEKIGPEPDGSCIFHAFITDFRLRGMDALEMIKNIRQEKKLKIPIVVVTGNGNEEIAIEALKLGADEYLVKRENYLFRLPSLILGAYQKWELLKQKEELEESEKRYRLLADNAGDVIFTLDLNLNYTYVSPSVKKMRGYTQQDLINKNISQTLTPASYEKAVSLLSQKFNGVGRQDTTDLSESVSIELEMMKRDGDTIWAEVKTSVLMDEHKVPYGILGVSRDISMRKAAEKDLFASREEYKMFFDDDLTGDYIATPEGKILNCNPAFISMLGFTSREEALSFNPYKLYKRPELRDQLINKLKKHGRLENQEFELIRLDGRVIHVIANIIARYNSSNELTSFIGYLFDNTQRRLANDKLRKLSQAVEQSPVSILISDTSGVIEYANPKFSEISGYSIDDLKGETPRILKSGHTSDEEYGELWRMISSGNEWNGEFLNNRKDGSQYWESASISPIVNEDGQITHYLAVKEDITDKKRYELELIKAKEKAEEANRLKTVFLQNISHEIRTPMNGIMGFSSLLKNKLLTSDKKDLYLNIINQSGERMLNTIDDIVEMSKLQIGGIQKNSDKVILHEFLESFLDLYKDESIEKEIEFSLTKEVPSSEIIITDRIKLYGILNNLLQNAFKFTRHGKIDFGCRLEGKLLVFYVSDTGIGIPSDSYDLIFERFSKTETALKNAYEGSGLGLAISKAYASIIEGSISVESEEGKGSVFYLKIPYQPAEIARSNEETEAFYADLSSYTVLVVEDDVHNSIYLNELLRTINIQIHMATDGFDAIEKIKKIQGIDLVLLDIKMPGINGYETAKRIKAINPSIKIIAQTGYASSKDRKLALEAGCDDHITKPIEQKHLFELMYMQLVKDAGR